MSTYTTDSELPDTRDEYGSEVYVSSSEIEGRVRLNLIDRNVRREGLPVELETEFYADPEYARQLAAALLRCAGHAERWAKPTK